VRLQSKGVEVWEDFIPTLDGRTNERSDGGIHPWLDDLAEEVIIGGGLEAVDSKAGRVDTKLDPAEEELRARLWAFESTNIVTIGLKK
jgi:hypothetical protein